MIATTVGYGDKTPKTTAGRIVGLVWRFSGLFVLAAVIASFATAFALNGGEEVELAGVVFQEPQYGVVLAQNPVLRERINRGSLRLIESGQSAALYTGWFSGVV